MADGYDAGVRSGEQVAKDMIAVRIGPDMRMAVVGTPSYFRKRPEPTKPQDLISQNCINLRLPSHGGLYAWEFEKGGRELKVRVDGQMTCNGAIQMLNAALAGHGLAYIPEEMAEPYLAKGRLKRVLGDWCQPYSGYHLFYPSRRQSSAAFNLVVEASTPPKLRHAKPSLLLRLAAKHDRVHRDQLERFDHLLDGGLVLQEVRCLQVSEIGFAVPVNLEHRDLAGIILVGNGVESQHARLQPDGGFDLFGHGRLVASSWAGSTTISAI